MDPLESAGSVCIEKQVVEVVLGEILLDINPDGESYKEPEESNDNDELISMAAQKKLALAVLKQTFADDDPSKVVDNTFRISNTNEFELRIGFVLRGANLRLVSRIVLQTKFSTNMGAFSNISDKKTIGFVRMALVINLPRITCILRSSWDFSIALDGTKHASISYLDLRVRFLCEKKICNFHLLEMPLLVRSTGETMLDLTFNLLEVL